MAGMTEKKHPHKHIFITGSSRGIGLAIAQILHAKGHIVVGHATRHAHHEVPWPVIAADFKKRNATTRCWEEALMALDGKIDVLINNAGIFEPNPIDHDDSDWLKNWNSTMAINTTGSAMLSRYAVKHFQDRIASDSAENSHDFRIVNIASRAAWRGDSPDHWHYAASKGAMTAMTKTIARAYAGQGIYAFAISPGFTMTGMAEDYLESRGGAGLLKDIPLGKVAMPEEIAEIASFCALDAPPSMTGAMIDANGASYVR